MYKICTISTTRSVFRDAQPMTYRVDLCDDARTLRTFETILEAEQAARTYAESRGFRYLEIGDISTPAQGQTFVEIGIA